MLKRKPLALDLFCGGGGACIGMQQAGFEVVGIDIKPHKNYPGHFIMADIHDLPVSIDDFDFVWASPPCQEFSLGGNAAKGGKRKKHPNLVEVTRDIFTRHSFACIENVPKAPIRPDLVLTAPTVGLPFMLRKRHFELSFFILHSTPWDTDKIMKRSGFVFSIRASGIGAMNTRNQAKRDIMGLPRIVPRDVRKTFMGIPYFTEMNDQEIGESVAPPMAEYIAKEALRQMQKEMKNVKVSMDRNSIYQT